MKVPSATVGELKAELAKLPDDAYVIVNPAGNLHISRTRKFQESDSVGYLDMRERPPRYVSYIDADLSKLPRVKR